MIATTSGAMQTITTTSTTKTESAAAAQSNDDHLRFMIRLRERIGSRDLGEFQVPGSVERIYLHRLVKQLLPGKYDDKELQFYLEDVLISHSIHDAALCAKKSPEETLLIIFDSNITMPKSKQSINNKDWISSLSLENDYIVAGIYNGDLNLWDYNSQRLGKSPNFGSGIRCIESGKKQPGSTSHCQFLGLEDGRIVVIGIDEDNSHEVRPIVTDSSHSYAVNCLAVSQENGLLLSCSDDTSINVFTFQKNDESTQCSLDLLSSINIHSHSVTSIFPANSDANQSKITSSNAVCSSMTGQVTLLDFEHSDEDSIVLQHALKTPVECLLPLPMSLTVLAGCYDNSVKLIDLRSSGESLSFILNSFTAHQNVVSRLVIDPLAAQNCFFSGSFDSSLKLWDIRHPARPLIDIRDHTGRVLSLAAAANHVVSGSTDGHLQLYNRSEM